MARFPVSRGRPAAVAARPSSPGPRALGLAAIGAGVWAATSFLATGAQPAEALPASTIGYASIDLDPSGGQKIEAFRMLNKFPAYQDEIGLDADDDIKREIFDRIIAEAPCAGLDYEADIEPWLGDRAAVAAVDTGEEEPVVAVVVQIEDAEAAEEGFGTLQECGDADEGGWVIDGEWAVLAETRALAEEVVAETERATLADDETYQQWTGEVGDAGVLNLYAAPAAGDYLADNLDELGFPFGPMSAGMSRSRAAVQPQLPDEMVEGLRDFRGVAATLRFDDGALELESVGDAADDAAELLRHRGRRRRAGLPARGHRRGDRRRVCRTAGPSACSTRSRA